MTCADFKAITDNIRARGMGSMSVTELTALSSHLLECTRCSQLADQRFATMPTWAQADCLRFANAALPAVTRQLHTDPEAK